MLRKLDNPASGSSPYRGCRLSLLKQRVSRYNIKNNSPTQTVEHLYVDHSASCDHGGYAVVTKENAIKSVTGWTRFAFSLKPLEEKTFHVVEEVTIFRNIVGRELERLLNEEDDAAYSIDKEARQDVIALLKELFLSQVYDKIRKATFTEHDIMTWASGLNITNSSLPTDMDLSYCGDNILELSSSVIRQKAEINSKKNQISNLERHIKEVFTNQSRLRDNIKSLEKLSNHGVLIDRYLSDLNQEEDDLLATRQQIAALTEEIEQHTAKLKAKEAELAAACDLEPPVQQKSSFFHKSGKVSSC